MHVQRRFSSMMADSWHHTFLTDLAEVQALNECKDFSNQGANSGGQVAEDRLSARRLHKADREKLRRDKLNDQFAELANALDAERPKNDKATILGESIQVVKDLRDEVKRLKTEHTSLLEESNDLSQEKNELQEEKISLKNETERLQNQLQQRLRSPSLWMALDPSLVMGPSAAYHYPIPVAQPISLPPSEANQVGGPRASVVSPVSFMPMPPPGPFHMHPPLQPYAVFGNRMGEGGAPFMSFSGFPPSATSQPHNIERPYAQYPSSVQPAPGYAVQHSSSQGSPESCSPLYKSCTPDTTGLPTQTRVPSPVSKDSSDRLSIAEKSSKHESPTETEEREQGSGRDGRADDMASPVKLDEATISLQDPNGKDANLQRCESNALKVLSSTLMGKEEVGFYSEKGRLSSLIAEGHVQILVEDSEVEHDLTLRPPAA